LPYTYQRWTTINNFLKQNPKRIGTEEILLKIFINKETTNERTEFFGAILNEK